MNQNDEKQNEEMKIPISVIMDMAKCEIGSFVVRCMQVNDIPPDLMSYVLKDVLSDITQAKVERLSEKYMNLQQSINRQGD